jgi:phosphoribosylformylglycinamidine synthase I
MSNQTNKPKILILHVSGTNRDAEAARAAELAGGAPEIVHINQLRQGERSLDDYAMLLLPGGFSYGDALGAGARLALDLRIFFEDQLHQFVDSGRLVLGICNGFQTLVKCGLLPGNQDDGKKNVEIASGTIEARRVTLTENASGHFECRWVHLQVNPNSPARYLAQIEDLIFCPVAHGEGNFQVVDEITLRALERDNLITFRYVDANGAPVYGSYPANPSGSIADIAGICNPAGNVVGLMPHPEDHVLPIQNPLGRTGRLGLPIFKAMIHAASHV